MKIRNPVFTADGRVDCEIEHPRFGWIPFTADLNDIEPHGREIHARALEMGPAPYVAPEPDPVDLAAQARAQRNSLLAASDWTQIPDAPVNAQAWATYRQELRDIPQQAGFPANINWPTVPE